MGRTDAENTSSSSKCNSAMSCSYKAATNLGCITTLRNSMYGLLVEAEVRTYLSTHRTCAVSNLSSTSKKSPMIYKLKLQEEQSQKTKKKVTLKVQAA